MKEQTDTEVLEALHYRSGERLTLTLQRGYIASMKSEPYDDHGRLPYIGPGLFDLQVNGYGGVDFNSPPLQESSATRVTQNLWQEGVTSYLPTIITNGDEEIERAVRGIAEARSRDALIELSIPGVHLEGPFVSPEDGPRGAHDKAHVKPPDWSLFKRWQEAAEGAIKLVTLSPEWPEAPNFIAKCVESGVVVAIGHTAAASEQIREAVSAGATLSTHFGNGAHPVLPRHPNYLWEQLAHDELWASVIADGFHLPESVLKVVSRVKGPRSLLVSDAVSFAGMEPGEYDTPVGGKVVLTPEGRLHLAHNPSLLAGSVRTLREGVGHMVRSRLSYLPEAWEMASERPASLMYASVENSESLLSAGAPADLVLFRYSDDGIEVSRTYKHGTLVYEINTEV